MLRNSVFSLITTVVRLATGLVMFIVLAHIWGPERFGVFMYPYAIAAILVKLVDYGFLLQVARDVGKRPADAHATMGRAFAAKLTLLVPTVIVTGVVALYLPAHRGYALLLGILLCDALANSFLQFLIIPLRALGRFGDETRIASLHNAVLFASVVGIAALGYGPLAAAVGLATIRLACLALPWKAYRHVIGHAPRPTFEKRSLVATLSAGFPFGVHATVGTLIVQMETLMVQHYLGATSVGLYQAGLRLLLGALLLGDALNSVYLSTMARISHDHAALNALGTRMTRHLLVIGLVAFAGTVGVGGWGVDLLFGARYGMLVPLLPLFGVLMLIRYWGISYGTLLTLADRQAVRVIAVCVVMVLGAALNALLIPYFGLVGAIVASIAGHVVLYGVYMGAARKDHGSFLMDARSGALVGLGIALFGASLLASEHDARVRVAVGLVAAVLAVLVGTTREERRKLAGMLRPASRHTATVSRMRAPEPAYSSHVGDPA